MDRSSPRESSADIPRPRRDGALSLLLTVLQQQLVDATPEALLAVVEEALDEGSATPPAGPDDPALRAALTALIHRQHEVRDRLELDAARFELLANTLSDAVWEWDLRNDRVWRNTAMTSVFGYPPAMLTPDSGPWTAAIHPEDRDGVVGSLRDAIEGGDVHWQRDYRMLRHDGTIAHVTDRNYIVRDRDGTALRVVGGVTDISDRWEAEEALRVNEDRFRGLAEHSSEGIFLQTLHPESRFEYLNPAMEAMLGYPREQVYRDPALMMAAVSERDRHRMWDAVELLDATTEPLEIDLRHRTGEVRRVRIRCVVLRDPEGRIINLQAAVTDVTREHRERIALREALGRQRQLNELKTDFVQAVSHELRTPLTTIQGFVELLLRREFDDAEQRRYLERIAHGADRLNRLVSDVLDLDRFDTPEAAIDPERIDVADLVRRAVEEIDPGTHAIHLELHPVTLVADGVLLERVVDNLVRNAIKHTPDGTSIWVRTRSPGSIVVEDAGPGVRADVREQLFEPFRRGPDQRDHPTPGIGIGLALCRRIVRLHDGEVVLDGRPGGGSRFTVSLPPGPRTP